MKRVLVSLALAAASVFCCAQTHTFPATDTNNTFTGTNSFKNLNNIRFADQFNATDVGAGINSAIADLPSVSGYRAGVIYLTGYVGTNNTSTSVTISSPYISIIGPGSGALLIQYNGSGDFLRINTSPFSTTQAGRISGFTINGTVGGASGIHVGDIIGLAFDDIVISAFTGASASGLWFDNVTNWTERTNLSRVWTDNCTKQYRFTVNGGTASFGYTRVKDARMNVRASQTGISLEAGTSLYNSELSFIANVNVSSGTVLSATGGASASKNTYDIKAECTSCSGGTLVAVDATSTVAGVGNIVSLSGLNLSITAGGSYSLAALGMEAIPSGFPLDLTVVADDRTININPLPPAGTGTATIKLFRSTNTAGTARLSIDKADGTNTETFGIDPKTGNTISIGTGGFTGAVTSGTNGTAGSVVTNGPAASNRTVVFKTAGVDRWYVRAGSSAEGGSNAGSDLEIVARDDAGALLFTPLTVARQTGIATFQKMMTLGSIAFASLGTPANGTVVYCTDCNSTCTAGASTGRTCFRENGAWTH